MSTQKQNIPTYLPSLLEALNRTIKHSKYLYVLHNKTQYNNNIQLNTETFAGQKIN
jgi:hypothetical protein